MTLRPWRLPYVGYRCLGGFFGSTECGLSAAFTTEKRAGSDALLFTEHPAAHYDFVTDGHTGLVDGVLLVPGAETKGMLVYPRSTVTEHDALGSQDLVRRVRAGDGMMFLCHLEERMDSRQEST